MPSFFSLLFYAQGKCAEWLHRHISRHCKEFGIRRPRNKYADVAKGLPVLPQEKEGEGFKDKDVQAPHDRAS